jgi:hypothetical protein
MTSAASVARLLDCWRRYRWTQRCDSHCFSDGMTSHRFHESIFSFPDRCTPADAIFPILSHADRKPEKVPFCRESAKFPGRPLTSSLSPSHSVAPRCNPRRALLVGNCLQIQVYQVAGSSLMTAVLMPCRGVVFGAHTLPFLLLCSEHVFCPQSSSVASHSLLQARPQRR